MGRALLSLLVIATLIATAGCFGRLVTAGGESGLGGELAVEVERSMGLVPDAALQSYVARIGARLVEDSPDEVRGGLAYRFQVVDLQTPNAFALPGGYVYVSRGLLALLASEDELANVLAHEIAHVSSRHHLQLAVRQAPFVPVNLATGIGAFAAGIVSPTLGRAVAAVGAAPGGLVLASYSRGQEADADALGQRFAASAGWSPAAMSDVMESLGADERQRGGDPERRSYFATHPTSPERARDTRRRAATLAVAERAPVAADARGFLARLEGLLVGPPARQGVIAGHEFLHPELDFRIAFPDGWEITDGVKTLRAVAENEDALALLAIVAQDITPEAAAKAALDRMAVDVDLAPTSMRIGGLDAVRALARLDRAGKQFRYVFTWIAHGDLVYQISAGAYAHAFVARSAALDAVGRSFRPLVDADWPRIREGRLRIVTAKRGQTLADLLPADGAWTLEETAVANALNPDAAPAPGTFVKIAPKERYVPTPEVGSPAHR